MPAALYSQLQQVALTGTRRLPLSKLTANATSSANAIEHALHCALTQADTPEPLRLLRTVAVAAVIERATWRGTPVSQPDELNIAPVLTQAPFAPEIVQAMRAMFHQAQTGSYAGRTLTVALLRSLREAKQSLPPELLLYALSVGSHRPGYSTDTKLRPYLGAVLGARGYWLAQQNPTWQWAAWLCAHEDKDTEAIWQHGNMEQRHALLLRERETDPDAARERLAASFDQMNSKERSLMIEVLDTHLSMNDEPFLEGLLNRTDRTVGKNLRPRIVDLLDKLPQSHHSQRMSAIVKSLLQQDENGIWQIEPPDDFDPTWLRDGISADGYSIYGGGRRAACLRALTAHTPLCFWTQTTGMSAEELITWSNKTPWKAALQQGWAMALENNNSPDNSPWFDIFLLKTKRHYERQEMLSKLPQAQREAIWLKDLPTRSSQDLAQEIKSCQGYSLALLSAEFSQYIIKRIGLLAKRLTFRITNILSKLGLGDTKTEMNEFPEALNYLNEIVIYLDDSVLTEVDNLLNTYHDQWSKHWPDDYQNLCQQRELRRKLQLCQAAIAERAQTAL